MAHRTKLVNILQKSFIESVGIWVLRNSSRVICLTQAEAAEVNQLGIPRRRITVIPSGVDTKKFAPSATEGNYVLWLGRFVPEKGIECLIEAASILAKRGLDVDFLLVGSGPLKRRLQESAKMTGGARIRFADSIPYSLVPNVMKACMVFVLPSIREGFPRTLLEAMSSGKPVIATNTPTLREIVGGCGILVQPRDAKSLADAIAKLATEPHYRKALGESARARVLDEYDWRHVLEKLDSVYEEVVANPGT
jgi:glycosyltransferase involved in cell wall biosynthesis